MAVALLAVAGLVAWALDASGGLVLALAVLAAFLVIPVATVITVRRERRQL